jgi:hypothetical protein
MCNGINNEDSAGNTIQMIVGLSQAGFKMELIKDKTEVY